MQEEQVGGGSDLARRRFTSLPGCRSVKATRMTI